MHTDQEESNEQGTSQSAGRSFGAFLLEVAKVVIVALAIIIPVKQFLFQPFSVKGASMLPNFHDNEYLIVNEIGYRLNEPTRGDVVVLRFPNDPSQYFIKRIVGLPGETVEIAHGAVTISNSVYPEGFVLKEEAYLPKGTTTSGNVRVTLSSSQYYVLGDNRSSSLDSRSASLGPIPRSAIIGEAWLRLWPVNRITVLQTPVYSIE